jgi:diacylglycerol kinase family enzyme
MPANRKPVVVLWNASSGWNHDSKEATHVMELLSESGAPLEFEQIAKGQDITAASRAFIKGKPKILVAAGGDGTLNAVASAVVNTGNVLGVIPAGTLNHLARDLAIPLSAEAAAASMLGGHEIQIDVGAANNRFFLNNSIIGLYPFYRTSRDAYERRGLGLNRITRFIAVFRSFARTMWRLPQHDLRLTFDGGSTLEIRTAFVLIANNDHELEHWNLGHRASLDDGHLWIYILKRSTRWSMLRFFLHYLFKRFSRHEAFHIFKARGVRVESKASTLKVGLDGEIARLETPLEYRSLPRALRVIAPAKAG